jgi:hypothetical protein
LVAGLFRPKSLDERYEALAGEEDERMTYYMARRHLGFDRESFDALPWHERRSYIEGLELEFGGDDDGD